MTEVFQEPNKNPQQALKTLNQVYEEKLKAGEITAYKIEILPPFKNKFLMFEVVVSGLK